MSITYTVHIIKRPSKIQTYGNNEQILENHRYVTESIEGGRGKETSVLTEKSGAGCTDYRLDVVNTR